MAFQQEGRGTADKRRCHGCTAHADIMGIHHILAAAVGQGEIIIGRKDGNDIVSRGPEIGAVFLCEAGKGSILKIMPVFPCAYGNDAAADSGRGTVSAVAIGISCGGYHHDTCLPEPFHCFFQRKVDLSVVCADGKIYYSDIIFAKIVHYPSEGTNGLSRISLTASVEDLDGNDIYMGGDSAIDALREGAVSAGNTRDMGHGSKDAEREDFLAFCVCLR